MLVADTFFQWEYVVEARVCVCFVCHAYVFVVYACFTDALVVAAVIQVWDTRRCWVIPMSYSRMFVQFGIYHDHAALALGMHLQLWFFVGHHGSNLSPACGSGLSRAGLLAFVAAVCDQSSSMARHGSIRDMRASPNFDHYSGTRSSAAVVWCNGSAT